MSPKPPRPSQLRLMSDYRAPTPLWLDTAHVLGDLAPLGLSAHLVESLHRWQLYFDAHFSSTGWDADERMRWYAAEGEVLRERLSRALPDTTIILDLWPVQTSRSGRLATRTREDTPGVNRLEEIDQRVFGGEAWE